MSYSGNTVAQLKELLKQRNLSTDGLKADLITRLQEDDAKNAAAEPKPTDASSQAENKTESATAQENKDETTHQSAVQTGAEAGAETQAPAQAQDPAPAETSAQTPTPAPKPQLSPEQLKQTAIDHLQKKIHRAEKFGQDDSIVEDLKRQINRIEKFGLDLTTQLAQELGFGKGPRAAIGKPNRKPFQKKHKNKKNIKRN
ncbi:protein THO1 [Kluyveromyces marxianus]|uniref:Protein THO1 n=1 Tax=Kluyveromyces marxianus TaxID=4911 RepID=A0ABX6F2P7_KLUMA|nr:protein THO1 [Kluyveromyces marxianus]